MNIVGSMTEFAEAFQEHVWFSEQWQLNVKFAKLQKDGLSSEEWE